MKITSTPQLHQSHFIVFTSDGGQTWNDLSVNLNNVSSDKEGKVRDYLTDIISVDGEEILVLSLLGKIFKTINNGKNWKLVDMLPDEPSQTCICYLDKTVSGKITVGGGTNSIEGSWGMIAFQEGINRWK